MGDLEYEPQELVQEIYWHSGGSLFDACTCNNLSECDRVQVLLPKLTVGSKRYPTGLFEGDLKGAVVFGRSDRLSKWWPKNPKFEPKDTKAACIAEDTLQSGTNAIHEGAFHDSGLGSEETNSVQEASSSNSDNRQNPLDSTSPPGLLQKAFNLSRLSVFKGFSKSQSSSQA